MLFRSDAAKTVTLLCDTPVQLGAEPTAFCFTLPAGSLTKGFELYVNDNLYGQMLLTGTAGKNTILRSACKTAPQPFVFSITAINPETALKGIGVSYATASAVLLPEITGTNNGWKVYWGDGSSETYSPLLEHTYATPSEKVAVFYAMESFETVTIGTLYGVNTIYINTLY